MTKTFTLDQIKTALPSIDLIPAIEAGFVAYSAENAVVPPVGELLLDKGEVHIKYGYIKSDDYYVIKIASGFYGNPEIGLPTSNGMMLLFSQHTGEIVSIMLDRAFLTDTRTAVAGAIAAKYMAPKVVSRIGIVGTGVQGKMQLELLKDVTSCRKVMVWGRGQAQIDAYIAEMESHGFSITGTLDASEIAASCNLIVTTTPATEPLLSAETLQPGTHITAVGSDTPHKQELDAAILARADVVVADSIPQCLARGEIFKALEVGAIEKESLLELGNVIAGKSIGRSNDEQITIADLTGVAVQDIQITVGVYEALSA